MSDDEIAVFTESVTHELHANITADDIREELKDGAATIHRSDAGFYIMQPGLNQSSNLWVLYVDPDCRGGGVGRRLLKDAIDHYGNEYLITLSCHASLRQWYSRSGFYVNPYDQKAPDMRAMIGPFKRGEFAEWRQL